MYHLDFYDLPIRNYWGKSNKTYLLNHELKWGGKRNFVVREKAWVLLVKAESQLSFATFSICPANNSLSKLPKIKHANAFTSCSKIVGELIVVFMSFSYILLFAISAFPFFPLKFMHEKVLTWFCCVFKRCFDEYCR